MSLVNHNVVFLFVFLLFQRFAWRFFDAYEKVNESERNEKYTKTNKKSDICVTKGTYP